MSGWALVAALVGALMVGVFLGVVFLAIVASAAIDRND